MKKHVKKRAMDNYQKVMTTMTEQSIVEGLFESLEKMTGMKATEQQREYVNNLVRQHAMKWTGVMTKVEEATEDPEIVAKCKQKMNGKD